MIHSTIPSLTVARVYLRKGSGMGNEHFVLDNIFIGKTREEVDSLICQEYKIEDGNIEQWKNYHHNGISYDET